MLLYLNKATWAGDGAEALAEQVRAARRARLPIVMAHENDAVRGGSIFGHFSPLFRGTPRDLISDWLYGFVTTSLAVGCHRLGPASAGVARPPRKRARSDLKQTAQSRVRCAALSLYRRRPAALLFNDGAVTVGDLVGKVR